MDKEDKIVGCILFVSCMMMFAWLGSGLMAAYVASQCEVNGKVRWESSILKQPLNISCRAV